MTTASEYAKMSDSEKKKEDWMNNKWRPMMGWMYMVVCMADFVIFPILWSVVQVHGGGEVKAQWVPITLQGAGLFHIAMGAILGIAAYGRTQEKVAGANNGGLQLPTSGGFGGPAPMGGGFSSPASMGGGFGGNQGGFSSPAPMVPRSTTVTTTFGSQPMTTPSGKKIAPVMDEPEL
jgi:Holin of 3TMs, for gene-transfer release